MIELCRQKGLEAREMDFEQLDFPPASFDGVWAYTSLLHLPKQKLDSVLQQIRTVLTKEGVFLIGMKEGSFEGYPDDPRYAGTKRYMAFYTEQELVERLIKHFVIIHVSKIVTEKKQLYLNIFCKLRDK